MSPTRGPAEGFGRDELQLATRNHGMPLEAMQWDLTPAGLHYVLVHYDIPRVDEAGWSLEIGGLIGRRSSLTLERIRALPRTTITVTMECAGNGRASFEPRPVSQPWIVEAVGTAEWTGTLLGPLLAEANPDPAAVEVLFTGLDRGMEGGEIQQYERSLPLGDVVDGVALLAYELNGQPLPPQHGFPLRLIVPGWYGMTNVKWLTGVTLLDRRFDGYQMAHSYRLRADADDAADEGTPLTRMRPRSLMVPPGIPDFMSRRRLVRSGPTVLSGRAWSGQGPIAAVEVSTDGGRSWEPAVLGDSLGRWAWRSWSFPWTPSEAGDMVLCSRATDSSGDSQPWEAEWNVGGYANNAVQMVEVTVSDRA